MSTNQEKNKKSPMRHKHKITPHERNISTINYIQMKETQADKTPQAQKNPNAGDTSKQILMEKKESISESMICCSNMLQNINLAL
jgi:hypothetical protein